MGIELARKAHTWLWDRKEQYNPAIWISETQTDLAGRICLDAGAEVAWAQDNPNIANSVYYDGDVHTVPGLAQQLLGITIGEANALFGPRVSLRTADRMIKKLEADHMLLWPARSSVTAVEHAWTDHKGYLAVACHRRTVIVYNENNADQTHHASRAAAYDYVTDLASCRTLTYHHNRQIWETHL